MKIFINSDDNRTPLREIQHSLSMECKQRLFLRYGAPHRGNSVVENILLEKDIVQVPCITDSQLQALDQKSKICQTCRQLASAGLWLRFATFLSNENKLNRQCYLTAIARMNQFRKGMGVRLILHTQVYKAMQDALAFQLRADDSCSGLPLCNKQL